MSAGKNPQAPMSKTITQKIIFKNTTPKTLYELYMDARKHSAVTGGKAVITKKEGAKFSSYDKYITGKNLQLIKDKLIVQSWRASDWKDTDMDSTFILSFTQKGNDVIMEMVHANVPDEQAKSLTKGWDEYYWKPMKGYLKIV
jgi:activator of HSP90 ATPase